MITPQSASILWAVLATVYGLAVYVDMRRTLDAAAKKLSAQNAELKRTRKRADHYASSWGRIMRKLRFAEKANLDLRTELIRRQTAEKEAA